MLGGSSFMAACTNMSHPNARLLVLISLVSSFGSTAMMVAAPVWTLDLTGSSGLAAISGVFLYVPTLFAPILGSLTDRLPRLPLLVWTNIAMAGVLATLLAVRSKADLWLLFAVMLAYGASHVTRGAAEAGLLQAAMPAEALGRLNGQRMSAREGMKLIAPLVGAGLYTVAGGHAVALIDAAALLVAAGLYARVRAKAPAAPAVREPLAGPLKFLAAQRKLRMIVLACSVCVAMSAFITAAQFSVIVEDLGKDPAFSGVLTSAQGAGSIVSGLLAGRLLDRFGAGAGALVFGIGIVLRTLPLVPITMIGSFVIGIGLPWTVVAMMTAVQRQTPPSLVGGVTATAEMATFAPIVLANPLGAAMVQLVDHRLCMAFAAAVTVALARIR